MARCASRERVWPRETMKMLNQSGHIDCCLSRKGYAMIIGTTCVYIFSELSLNLKPVWNIFQDITLTHQRKFMLCGIIVCGCTKSYWLCYKWL